MLAMVEDHSPANQYPGTPGALATYNFLYKLLTHARKVVQYPSTLYVLFY